MHQLLPSAGKALTLVRVNHTSTSSAKAVLRAPEHVHTVSAYGTGNVFFIA
jgi:hypothetical protein